MKNFLSKFRLKKILLGAVLVAWTITLLWALMLTGKLNLKERELDARIHNQGVEKRDRQDAEEKIPRYREALEKTNDCILQHEQAASDAYDTYLDYQLGKLTEKFTHEVIKDAVMHVACSTQSDPYKF